MSVYTWPWGLRFGAVGCLLTPPNLLTGALD